MNYFDAEEDAPVRRRRRNEPDFWHRINRVLTGLVLLGIFLGVAVMFYPVWQKQRDMRAQIAALEREKEDITVRLAASKRQAALLRNDLEYAETIARDRLNLMKPGEMVFRVEIPRTIGTSVQP